MSRREAVRALVVVGFGAFDRISRIAEVQELGAFDDAARVDVEAGNDAFGEHGVGRSQYSVLSIQSRNTCHEN